MSKSHIVSKRVISEPGAKITLTAFELSKETQEALTLPAGTRIPAAPYRYSSREGDYVRLPNGRTGTVYMVEIAGEGHSKIISVRLDKPKRRWLRWLGFLSANPKRFVDGEIDRLELLATQAELDAMEL